MTKSDRWRKIKPFKRTGGKGAGHSFISGGLKSLPK